MKPRRCASVGAGEGAAARVVCFRCDSTNCVAAGGIAGGGGGNIATRYHKVVEPTAAQWEVTARHLSRRCAFGSENRNRAGISNRLGHVHLGRVWPPWVGGLLLPVRMAGGRAEV